MAGHRVPVGRRVLHRAAASLLLAVLWFAWTPVRGASASAADATGVACAVAQVLVEDGLPQRALRVIAQARLTPPLDGSACAEAFAKANAAVQASLAKSAAAKKSLDKGKYEAAKATATEALASDRENTAATTVHTSAQAAIDGHLGESGPQTLLDQWDSFFESQLKPLAALLVPFLGVLAVLLVLARLLVLAPRRWRPLDDLSARSTRGWVLVTGLAGLLTGAGLLSISLSDVAELPLTPVDGGVVFGLAIVVGALAVFIAGPMLRDPRGADDEARRFPSLPVLIGAGAVLVAAAAVALVLTATTGTQLSAEGDAAGVLAVGILTSCLGATLLAWWLATRIRLTVSVTGPEDKASAADVGAVVALLGELGAEKPQGLEVPRGADVTALEGAFADLPDNAVLKALKSFIRGVSGVTPWSVALEGPAEQRAISISRNGRSVRSALICPDQILPPAPREDAGGQPAKAAASASSTGSVAAQVGPDPGITFSASFVLATLARDHPSMAQGLAGATDWRSIGLQFLGTVPGLPIEQKRARLALAVDADPANLSAALAYRHALDRSSTSYDDLVAYRDWLLRFDETLADAEGTSHLGLRLRARYTRAVIALNAVYAPDGALGAARTLAQELVRSALDSLENLQTETTTDADLQGLNKQFAHDVTGIRYLVGLDAERPEPTSLFGMYNLACTLASRNDVVWTPTVVNLDDDEDAVVLLRRASGMPDLRDWMNDDPQLDAFRKREGYRRAFLKAPRTDLLAVEPLSTFAAALKANGLVQPRIIASTDRRELALVLGTTTGVADHLVDVCTLHESLQTTLLVPGDPDAPASRPLARWAVEIVAELEKRGLASTPALRRCTSEEQEDVASTVAEAVLLRCSPTKDDDVAALDLNLPTYLQEWIVLVTAIA
ncbi:hypothetical protein FHX52_4532 [Humibacillus xanthopallidus]|uniref:Uncharacterized protein n=1 Tax=Humibacillus xanthopallidus TaxID=412689 RepID=A0A543PMJ1_9MICO|nr:hypothetical protein [Humibacillus xanthopallidus]TQN45293.1 hypothetical protein FHX52_4532 [Humibacillus xanthopallidus]